MKTIFALALAAVIGWMGLAPETAQAQDNYKPKVVYHLDNAYESGLKALRNIRNHLDTAPETDIVLVAHAAGVDMFIEGARHGQSDTSYGPLISALKSRGVEFQICEITLKLRNMNKEQFVMDVDFTPSGVVALTDLQLKDGRAYIKP